MKPSDALFTKGAKTACQWAVGGQRLFTAESTQHLLSSCLPCQVPKSVAVIGSGYIAVEFAGIFNGLGSEVHLVFRKDLPLNGFDEEVGVVLGSRVCDHGSWAIYVDNWLVT